MPALGADDGPHMGRVKGTTGADEIMRFKIFDANNTLQYIVDGPNEPTVHAWLVNDIEGEAVKVVLVTHPDVCEMPGPLRIERA
jgi:hypothetical protein